MRPPFDFRDESQHEFPFRPPARVAHERLHVVHAEEQAPLVGQRRLDLRVEPGVQRRVVAEGAAQAEDGRVVLALRLPAEPLAVRQRVVPRVLEMNLPMRVRVVADERVRQEGAHGGQCLRASHSLRQMLAPADEVIELVGGAAAVDDVTHVHVAQEVVEVLAADAVANHPAVRALSQRLVHSGVAPVTRRQNAAHHVAKFVVVHDRSSSKTKSPFGASAEGAHRSTDRAESMFRWHLRLGSRNQTAIECQTLSFV